MVATRKNILRLLLLNKRKHKTGESVPREQTFDIERYHRTTALQAYKLLAGLSLEKDIYVRAKDAEPDARKTEKNKGWFKLQLEVISCLWKSPA